jgi:hypothetical protein
MNSSGKTAALGAVAGLALLAIACGKDNTSSTTPTQTPAAPTATEHYVGTINVGVAGFYSFTVSQYGTVNVTLTSVTGADDPAVGLGLGLGIPSGFGCSTSNTITASAGTDPQITGSYSAGVYCVRLYDVGNLTGADAFDVIIAHP